jgi:hypothetical protein
MHSCRDIITVLDDKAKTAGSKCISELLYTGKQLRNLDLIFQPWRTVGQMGFLPSVANAAQTSIAQTLRARLQVTGCAHRIADCLSSLMMSMAGEPSTNGRVPRRLRDDERHPHVLYLLCQYKYWNIDGAWTSRPNGRARLRCTAHPWHSSIRS